MDRIPKIALAAGAAAFVGLLAYVAYTRPFYFSSSKYLGGLIVLEFLVVATWLYRRFFLVLVVLAFLLAGVELSVGGMWTSARWVFLIAGASVGSFIMLKERRGRFGLFHALAILALLSALISAAVSRYPGFALLKAVSLVLLFVYAGTGARLAAADREKRFFAGLLLGCEIFVVVIAGFYLIGSEVMGNPNSLGAVTSVVAPVLLWGTMIQAPTLVHHRRLALYVLCMGLLFHSRSRAGLFAGLVSCGLLCLCLRKYKLFGQGVVIILILVTSAAIFDPQAFSGLVSSLTNSIIYKDRDSSLGVFASRTTPWQGAVDSIHKHFWFGTGFGTTDSGRDATAHLGQFSSSADVTVENGSSYLTILSWVGMLGILPFSIMLLVLLGKVVRTLLWMLNTGSPFHPAIPVAMIVLAGMAHAAFEDWLFAPGYYLCVFFWSLAFVLVDLAPWAPLPGFSGLWRPWLLRQRLAGMAPSR